MTNETMRCGTPVSQIKVGDWVGFKCDIEQSGQVKEIRSDSRGTMFLLANDNGFHGEYIRGMKTTEEAATDCWAKD